MIIKIEENIKSFSSWTNMVKANAEKIKGFGATIIFAGVSKDCLLYTSPSPRDGIGSRMPSSA